MKNVKILSLSALTFALVLGTTSLTGIADAQQSGPGRGGQGGGQFGAPGAPGGQFGGMRRGGMILNRADVQKELQMTEDQIAKVRALMPAPPQGGPQGGGGFGGQRGQAGQGGQGGAGGGQRGGQQGQGGVGGGQRGQGGGPGGPGAPGGPGGPGPNPAEMDAKVKEILNPNQYNRYKELELQFMGVSALLRDDVAKKVGLSEKQVSDIQAILRGGMRGPGAPGGAGGAGGQGGFRGGQQGGQQGQGGNAGGQRGGQGQAGAGGQRGQGGPGAPPNAGAFEEMRKEQEAKVLAILTPQQKSTWESLKGKPFKFEMMQAPRSGGQGGRGGQGGGGQ